MSLNIFVNEYRSILAVLNCNTALNIPQIRELTGMNAVASWILRHRMNTLIAHELITRCADNSCSYSITIKGQQHLSKLLEQAHDAPETQANPLVQGRTIAYSSAPYEPLELRPFSARAGALNAFSLPSLGLRRDYPGLKAEA